MTHQKKFIQIKIDSPEPIELIDLAGGLYALADFYKRFSKEQDCNDEAQLFVESISKGSIIAKLITYAEKLPFLGDSKIIKFAKHLDAVLDLLSSGKELPNGETEMSQKDFEDTSKIAGVITKKKDSSLTITAYAGANVVVNNYMNNNDANAIQNRIRNNIDNMKKQFFGEHEKQVFYWYQARDASTKAGDKGIIKKFSPRPLPVIFSTEYIKTLMLEPALFSKGYIVDVEIGFIEQTPVSYKIMHFHQTIDKV